MARFICLTMLGLVALGGLYPESVSVCAQPARRVDPADGLNADVTFTDIYVNDSFEAADAVSRARSLARRGDWEEAAELLQKTSDESGDKLVRVAPGFYVGIRDHINELMAAWPEPGLEAYRFLYERDFQTALSDLGPHPRFERLLAVFDQYFCLEGVVELGERIAQLAIESGDLATAERTYRRILDFHPAAREDGPRLQSMLTLLAAIGGSPSVVPESRNTVIRWMGSDIVLGDALGQVGEQFSITARGSSPESWPDFGGAPERNRRASTTVDELGLLWRTELEGSPNSGSKNSDAHEDFGGSRGRSERLTVYPVVEGNLVFIQRFRDVVALHLNTGAVAWRFRADSAGGGVVRFLDEQPPGWDAVTVHDGRVYAALPGEALPYYSYESARSPSELVCLDSQDGRTIWRLDQQIIEEDFAEVLFDSSPLVRQGRMFVVGRRRRSFGFEDCYLYCFNTEDGTPIFRTHLGSASTGTFSSRQATKSIASMHGDTIYVCTNLGAVAAVSGTTGSVRWLRLYARVASEGNQSSRRSTDSHRSWRYNPVIWDEDQLFVMPSDADAALWLPADDGKLVNSIATSAMSNMETLLGVHDGVLCGLGDKVACYDLSTDELLWSSALPDDGMPFGRGIWSDDRLLIPGERGLSVFLVRDGERTFTRWDVEGEGGNVLALESQILVAGPTSLSAYVRLGEILSALRTRMQAAKSDPVPALELAEVALSNGEFADALVVLDDAVKRAGALGERLEPPVRRRLFDDLLMFARRLAAHDRLEPETLNALFGFASQFPPDAEANLAYRFQFAELFETFGAPDRAMELYEQVLRDRLLRELATDALRPRSEPAGTAARRRIEALIQQHGRAIYATYEAEAKGWLERGRSAADGAFLSRVVEAFPNSESAPLALIALGDLFVRSGQGERAARLFAKALHDYAKRVDRPSLLRKIADAYESAGMEEHAYRWLTKAAREHPSVRFEFGGGNVSFREYRDRLAHVRAHVDPSRPTIKLPIDRHFEIAFAETSRLMQPRFADTPQAMWSRFFVHTPKGIRAFDSGTGLETWPRAVPVEGKVGLLVAKAELILFVTPHEILAVERDSGARRWTYGVRPKRADDPDADWEENDTFRDFMLRGNRLVVLRESGRMICLAIDTGETTWSRIQLPSPNRLWFLSDTWVAYHVVQNNHPTIYLLNANSGEFFSAIDTEEKRAIESVIATIDGQIVVVGSLSVGSFEPESGRRRWHTPLRGRTYASSVYVDVDTLYLSDNGRTVKSLSLESGRVLWESERLVPRGREDVTVTLSGSSVIVSSSISVAAVDAVTGLTLWRGTTPEDARFAARFLTDAYFVAVDVPEEATRESVAYFYDHRNASGMIPREGGAAELAILTDFRAALAVDGGLLVQTGSNVQGWVHP